MPRELSHPLIFASSFEVAESKERHVAELRKATPSAAKGTCVRTSGISLADLHDSTELADLDWHTLPRDEVSTRLCTSVATGLSVEQAKRRLTEYGKNAPPTPPTHRTRKILEYFFKGFGSILLLGSGLVFISWKPLGQPPSVANLALAIVLLAVFVIQAAFNAWQDWSYSRVMASITSMLPDNCLIIRDGVQMTPLATEVVPGDVIRSPATSCPLTSVLSRSPQMPNLTALS